VNAGTITAPRRDELTIGASSAEIRRASEWLSATCLKCDLPLAQAQRLEICLNEVLANILAYGGSTALAAPIRLQLEFQCVAEAGEAHVTVSDAGVAFNPLDVKLPLRPNTLAEAPAGGLGLVMIRRCADWLDYRREGGHNHFTFGMRWNIVLK
jgi:anti-sigma regulatory factor (Ser/Thr protein kinase)